MKSFEIYQEWLEHDGKVIKIDGIKHRLKVTTLNAIYPRSARLISVQAEVINKKSSYYLDTKARMGDHWTTDVLDSDIELAADILSQARAVHPVTTEETK